MSIHTLVSVWGDTFLFISSQLSLLSFLSSSFLSTHTREEIHFLSLRCWLLRDRKYERERWPEEKKERSKCFSFQDHVPVSYSVYQSVSTYRLSYARPDLVRRGCAAFMVGRLSLSLSLSFLSSVSAAAAIQFRGKRSGLKQI